MEPATIAALGALLVSFVAMTINIIKAIKEQRSEDFRESAAYIRAQAETELGSVQAAERIIAMYSRALDKMQKEIDSQKEQINMLRAEVNELSEAVQMKNVEIAILKTQVGA